MIKEKVSSYVSVTLFQPEIAQNTGTILRLCACFGVTINIIEPCGFPFSAKAFKRSAMDYATFANVKTHANFQKYVSHLRSEFQDTRLILLTTKGNDSLWQFDFRENDQLIFGNESSGVSALVEERSNAKVQIPMLGGGRSLNVAVSAGIALGEATRQLTLCKM